jgi:hypothetical protein
VKIRLALAFLFALGLGTSVYYTHKAPAGNVPAVMCCGDPDIVSTR